MVNFWSIKAGHRFIKVTTLTSSSLQAEEEKKSITMQAVYILVALMAVAASARPEAPLLRTIVPLISRTEKHEVDGPFTLSYLTGDGITFSESGYLKPTLDRKDHVLAKEGSFSYTGPDGVIYELKYVADELGFRPIGKHLPVPVVDIPATF